MINLFGNLQSISQGTHTAKAENTCPGNPTLVTLLSAPPLCGRINKRQFYRVFAVSGRIKITNLQKFIQKQ